MEEGDDRRVHEISSDHSISGPNDAVLSLNKNVTLHPLCDITMTTKRSQSAVDFRRASSVASSISGYDPGGVTLHINPNRARTPRSSLVLAGSDGGTSTETSMRDDDIYKSDENTPLINNVANNSVSTFSHSLSQEKLKSSDSYMARLQNTLALSNWFPVADKRTLFRYIKIFVLFTITVMCCFVLAAYEEDDGNLRQTVLPAGESVVLESHICSKGKPIIRILLSGPFYDPQIDNESAGSHTFIILNNRYQLNLTINNTALLAGDRFQITEDLNCKGSVSCNLTAFSEVQLPVTWHTKQMSWQLENQVIYAFLVLAFVYILIIFELVHRTLAAMLGALAALAVMSSMGQRPSLETIISWLDMETLTLLFGMMILVAIFSETGFFDYSALKAYKLAKGKIWPLVTLLCVFSAIVSAFLDNVTTILLMTPVTIRLCEVLNLDPRRILIAEVLFSNIGGTATAIGDPPNVIIVGALSGQGVTFSTFTIHMFPGIVLISVVGYGLLRLYYRNMDSLKNKDPPDIAEMKHEVQLWRRAASRLTVVTREETVMKALFLQKAVEIEHVMNKTIHRIKRGEEHDLKETLKKLEKQYNIKNFPLLLKSGVVLLVVMICLFIYSFVSSIHLDIGWIAVLGALWLLVLADVDDMEGILHKVEWSTLIFFAGLFILMEALAELGMIKTIGDGIANIVTSVDEDNRLLLAVFVILWVSAIASSFIDNIPYTTAMVPVLEQLSNDPKVNLPLLPLVIALAYGACLGGNGTLIGASCNVVCAGIAEQHGYGFTFLEFFKIGFPMMLVTTLAATCYVLFCHVGVAWNSV